MLVAARLPSDEPLPDGTVTMLFTDIEGSTPLLARLGHHYPELLSMHRRLVRSAVAAHRGREMGTEGDSFFVVFARAGDAAAAAVRIQQDLHAAHWPQDAEVKVRMGLHTGEPALHEDDYVGMDVHLAARVASAARGGQIVITDATRALLGPALQATGLGTHRLKDIPEPQRLHELLVPGLGDTVRPTALRSLGSATGLPAVHHRLVGRDAEVDRVTQLLHDGSRLVTLLGPGGVGKSRLALEVATRRGPALADGVYFVPLARATGPDDVWAALARTLSVPGLGDSASDVRQAVVGRSMLLVLDNLEQLSAAATIVQDVLAAGPGVEVVATSRTPLRLAVEQLVPLGPLDGPAAAELYLENVRRRRPGYAPDDADEAAVRDICARLDGLPLAIELVASRSRLLGPTAMLRHLTGALDLTDRSVERSARQSTLRATLDWSWALLAPAAADALARLSVFRGPFDVDAAAAVLGTDPDEALDLLLELADASLVAADDGSAGHPQFWLLGLVGRYAEEQLEARPAALEEARTRQGHVMAELVRHQGQRLRGTHHIAALDVLAEQQGNLHQALDWFLRPDSPDLTTGLDMCRALSWHWHASAYQGEGIHWLTRASEVARGREDAAAQAAWHGLGILLDQHGDHVRAVEILERCLAAAAERGDRAAEGRESNSLGVAERNRGRLAAARQHFDRAIALAREDDAVDRLSNALSNLALLELDEDDLAAAQRRFTEVLEIDTSTGDVWGLAVDHLNLGCVAIALGDPRRAYEHLVPHGESILALGDAEADVELLEQLAQLAGHLGLHEVAALVLGCSEQLRERGGIGRPAPDAARLEVSMESARLALGPAGWASAYDAGRGLSPAQAWAAARDAITAAMDQPAAT